MQTNIIYNKSCRDMAGIDDESVQMIVTSPPYWMMRIYLKKDDPLKHEEIGLEEHPQKYIDNLVEIFNGECRRVLKKDGILFVNLGDIYFHGPSGSLSKKETSWERNSRNEAVEASKFRKVKSDKGWLQPKQLMMIPERFAIAMQEKGWILRNKICWFKPNHMPNSVQDRFANSFELIFFFTKSPKYYFNLDAVRIPWADSSIKRLFRGVSEDNKYNRSEESKNYGARNLHQPRKNIKEYQGKFSNIEDESLYGSPRARNIRLKKREIKAQQKEQLFKEQLPMSGGGSQKKCSEIMKNVQMNRSLSMTSPKYEGTEGHSNRQGLNRELSEVERRKYEVITKEVCGYLKEWRAKKELTTNQIAEIMQYPESTVSHWFRTDLSGACLPVPEQWKKLKQILQFDDQYDEVMTSIEITDNAIRFSNKGRNPADCWEIEQNKTDEFNYSIGIRDKEFIEFRNLPPLEEISNYLNEYRNKKGLTIEQIEGLNKEAYPSKEDWIKLKQILEFDDKYDKAMTEVFVKSSEKQNNPLGKDPSDLWFISTQSSGELHFAVFPEKLIQPLILCSTKPGDVVLDPFIGSGTTAKVALKYNRKYIGFELNKEYIEIAKKRINNLQIELPLF